MLARIANSLFWMARYLERSEHLARYAKVHQFSAIDAPEAQNKEDLLMSILKNAGMNYLYQKDIGNVNEMDVIYYVLLNLKNPYNIISSVSSARENARGARDSITTEVWEAINMYYHYINNIAQIPFDTDDTYEVTHHIFTHCAHIKGLIDNTLIHNDAWHLISMGLHLERATQICRIIITKTDDIANVPENELNESIQNYHWSTMLKCAESFDMCNRTYRATPSRSNALEFLLLNQKFPKSLTFNLDKAYNHMTKIAITKKSKDDFIFEMGKLVYTFKFLKIEEIDENIHVYLNATLDKMYEIAYRFEKSYLNY
ncbi:MAG: alpha-E domain-containing protein [Cytophagales bacterium]|nr:alpha-E domain-containing protein [Cytophagales bacterium]